MIEICLVESLNVQVYGPLPKYFWNVEEWVCEGQNDNFLFSKLREISSLRHEKSKMTGNHKMTWLSWVLFHSDASRHAALLLFLFPLSSCKDAGGKVRRFIPRLRFFENFYRGDQLEHINSTLYASIGLQWLSELRRLLPSLPLRFACELVSLIGSHTIPDNIVSPLRLYWVKEVCVNRYTLPSAFLAEWPGSTRATAVKWELNGYWIRVSTQS